MRAPGDLAEIADEIQALGMALLQAGRIREAAVSFRKVLALVPGCTDAALALGHCLHLQGCFQEALQLYDLLLVSSPGMVAAWNNRGTTLLQMCRYEEACASYSRAVELAPGLHDARVALATCYQAMGKIRDAVTACEKVLQADPGHAEAHWNRSLLLLLNGEFRSGWQEYEWRWLKRNFTSPLRDFTRPRWQGEAASGKTILIHAEQGFGDAIQFCRYIPLVAARGMRVIFECHPPLAELMKGLEGVAEVIPMGEPLPDFDLHLPLLSLPLIFDTTLDTIPNAVPYLSAPARRAQMWRLPPLAGSRYRVGLCWAGKSYPDPARSCPTEILQTFAALEEICWHSLQIGWDRPLPFPMNDNTDRIADFCDTAALISELDLVLTIDTAVAHLAGALGKPAWVMLPYAPDWRWLLERGDSPWYPTMRLFRQEEPGGWGSLIGRIGLELAEWVKGIGRGVREPDSGLPELVPVSLPMGLRSDYNLLHQGEVCLKRGDLHAAEACFRKLLDGNSASADAWNSLGTVLDLLGENEEAIAAYRSCLELDQGHAVAWFNLGNMLRKCGNAEGAEACYRSSCDADGELTPALHALGSLLIETGQPALAEAPLIKAAFAVPPNADARFSLGILSQGRGRQQEAGDWFTSALSLDPDHLQALTSLGMVCLRNNRLAEARSLFERAIRLDPGYWQAVNNLGVACHWGGDLKRAEACFESVLQLDPENASAHYNRSLVLLSQGLFEEGWREYEWRFRKEDPVPERHARIPRWCGEDLCGRRIMVHAEQGYGDTIHFVRYLSVLAERGGEIFLECQDRNIAMLLEGFPAAGKVFARGDAMVDVDCQIPLMSLPLMLGREAWQRPAPDSYLLPDPAAVQKWQSLLAGCASRKVGIVWAGRKEHDNNHNRSLPLDVLKPLAGVRGVDWVNLMVEGGREPAMPLELVDHTSSIASFGDTAALVACLDLVICVDSAVAHLAGALGKPVWCLVPFNPDWRWMRDRTDSPLYPSMKLFRQKEPDAWMEVVQQLAVVLQDETSRHSRLQVTF